MNTYGAEPRVSLPALAFAAVIGLGVTGGTAAMFACQPLVADANTVVASRAPAEALPMREIVPNRVDVIAVREPERVSFFQRVVQKVGG
jgi:hypothetical protein